MSGHALFQTFDLEADDYVPLATPIPDSDPKYAVELAASRERLRLAGRRDRGESTESGEAAG